MQCPRCQQENPPQAKFCLECAAPLAARCTQCGTQLPPNAKTCFECATVVAASRPSPAAYTPKHLADRILTSKAAFEGERKQVTVLFADLKGSMELLADRDPEEARKILDPLLEHMMEDVHRYEGTMNQVMGDSIMALFGAPLAHEDRSARLLRRAADAGVGQAVRRGRASRARPQHSDPGRFELGAKSWSVQPGRSAYGLHGGGPDHASRRADRATRRFGVVLLPPATLGLAGDFIQVRSLGPMPVKGMSEPIKVYELIGANPMRSRFHAHAARGLTKFVGRTSEMVQLAEALDLTRSGRGQVVAVVGEPGVGKSRLFWEFARSRRTDGRLVIEAASVSYGKATTYLPVIELLRGYFQIEPRDDSRKIREKVTGKLLSLDRALESALPTLLSLLDVPVDDEEWARLDPPTGSRGRRINRFTYAKLPHLGVSRASPACPHSTATRGPRSVTPLAPSTTS